MPLDGVEQEVTDIVNPTSGRTVYEDLSVDLLLVHAEATEQEGRSLWITSVSRHRNPCLKTPGARPCEERASQE